jgi:hypothetical protein
MGSEFQIRWTDEAIHNIETIIDFIKLMDGSPFVVSKTSCNDGHAV